MNNEPSTSGVTRRSFIKRSIVAAVAVSSMSIFSGLVKADQQNGYDIYIPSGCGLNLEPADWDFGNGTVVHIFKCSSYGAICDQLIDCGRMYEMDPFTGAAILDPITKKMIWIDIQIDCAKDRSPLKYCLRSGPPMA